MARYGAAGCAVSTAAVAGLPTIARRSWPPPTSAAAAAAGSRPAAPAGIDPQLFAKAKAALDQHKIAPRLDRRRRFLASRRAKPRFHVVDLLQRRGRKLSVAHGRGSDPDHSGFVEHFSNDFGIHASSNGAYTTGDYYQGKYGLSMKVRGLDWTNYNAEPRAIVIHNAWYAEPDMIAQHGKLGRCEGCFAFSRETS